LIVTDQGAGVHHAGAMYANVGDFSVSASGDIQIAGGTIAASGNLIVAAPGLSTTNGVNGKPSLSAGGNVDVRSTSIQLANATVSAGSPTITQAGDILLGVQGNATTTDTTIANSNLSATGGIGVFNQGHALQVNASTMNAQQNVLLNADSINLASSWNGQTAAPTQVNSSSGTVSITSPGALHMSGSQVNGTAGSVVNVSSLTLAASHSADGSALQRAALQSTGGAVTVKAAGPISITGSDLLAATDIATNSAGFILQNDAAARSTAIATNGAVTINSSTDILNSGSLIQGNTRNAANSASLGAVTLVAGGNILNQSPDVNTLAAVFGVNDDVSLQASGNIVNHYGRILTNNALHIAALGDVSNLVDKQAGSNNEQPQASQSQGRRWLILTKSSNNFSVDYGQLDRPDQLSYLVSYAGTTISGRNVLNLGGVILANNASDITINATQSFQNAALFSGQAQFQRSCLITCRSSASSTVQSVGGNISAGNNIQITAGSKASNIGGTVTAAAGNLTVSAPIVLAQGVLGYRAYEQSKGFKSWFGDTWAQLYAMDIGGSWMANAGKIVINGQEVIDGGSFSGAGGVTATGGVLTLKNPQNDPVTINRHLGLISWLWH
jgi:hypothetical protein